MYNKILVPTDGSIHSNNALRHGIWIANQVSANIIALNVIENHYLELTTQYSLINRMENMLADSAKESLDMASGILTEMKIEGKCKEDLQLITKIREGNPPAEILRMIDEEGIDLVVMGKSGRKGRRKTLIFGPQKSPIFEGIDQFLMGSTATKVVRNAPCSVLTVL